MDRHRDSIMTAERSIRIAGFRREAEQLQDLTFPASYKMSVREQDEMLRLTFNMTLENLKLTLEMYRHLEAEQYESDRI